MDFSLGFIWRRLVAATHGRKVVLAENEINEMYKKYIEIVDLWNKSSVWSFHARINDKNAH